MAKYVGDIEADSLDPSVVWCMVLRDIDTDEEFIYANGLNYPPVSEGVKKLQDAEFFVFHNGLWYDVPVLNRLESAKLDPEKCIDTLVVSRLLNSWDYSRHSLADWGDRLGGEKKKEHGDWSKLTPEMIERCRSDVRLNKGVYDFQKKYIDDERLKKAIEIEHRAAIICTEMHYNGFGFDIVKCKELYKTIEDEKNSLDQQIQEAFPPKQILRKTIFPVATKDGKINRKDFRWLTDGRSPEEHGYSVGVPVSLYDTIEFNPSSTKQCIERLWEFNWNPVEKTKGHILAERDRDYEKLEYFKTYGWTISEDNLDTLPPDAPSAAKLIVRFILLARRLTTLDEWIAAYKDETKSIHGEVRAIGTWTHRSSHKNPNTGNIARTTSEFGYEMRSLWGARSGWRQVGCDAEGIQLRILAHYMEDDTFTTALVSGSSDDGTDVHTLNKERLGSVCKDRTMAKTFIYSYLLGAAAAKTANIFGCSVKDATMARKKFVTSFPGLQRIREELIPSDAKRGFFWGIDGRPVMCDSEHLMLAGYLQNGEATVMKYANWLWREQLRKERIPFRQMAFVHDEIQWEVPDDKELAEYAGQVMANSIVQAGVDLGVKCPLAGKFITGYTWADCH